MRQLVANLQTGELELLEVPGPRPRAGELVVANEWSVVSPGTERMLLGFARASLAGKALREPARVRQALDKVIAQGFESTATSVRNRLQQPQSLGYSAAGVVLEIGEGVRGFRVGDRVATNAPHAEIASVWARHAARIPEEVLSRDAAWGTLGAVALNAYRQARVDTGGVIGVIGLGLLGQLVTRIADASGCAWIGLEPVAERAADAAKTFDEFTSSLSRRTQQAGADAIVITAPATRETLQLAARACRTGGTIVVVGAGDLAADRRLFYERELHLVVAHSYGPGRDEGPWERGEQDYPVHRVRWTAQRNLEVVLDLLARGRLRVDDISAVEYAFDDAPRAYDALLDRTGPISTLFRYPPNVDGSPQVRASSATPRELHAQRALGAAPLGVAVLGAGTFATHTLIPALLAADVQLRSIASRAGLSAAVAARRFGSVVATTDVNAAIDDVDTSCVFIATPHETHVDFATNALRAGKHVWLEKPAAIDRAGLQRLEDAVAHASGLFMVGFNRRFAPTARQLRAATRGLGPLQMSYTVHAGVLPADHWLNDPRRGGGRLVGEACHFVDLMRYLACAPIVASSGQCVGDSGWMAFEFADGSYGTINYGTAGHPRAPKERLEVSASGKTWVLDNFRRLVCIDDGVDLGTLARRAMPATQEKGHVAAVGAFLDAVRAGEASPVPAHESIEVTRAIFDALGL